MRKFLSSPRRNSEGGNGVTCECAHKHRRAIVGLHRPYSDLLFNPIEIISSCSTGPPDSVLIGELVNVHTIRCLKSVEAQIRLMALPARPFCHSPFVICMITAGTIPLLSACAFLFAGGRLEIARHQVRMCIGCLSCMSEIWPQAVVHVRELRTIAQEVLGLSSRTSGVTSDANQTRSGSSTAVDHTETQPQASFPSDSLGDLGDGFQLAWDNYDFTSFN